MNNDKIITKFNSALGINYYICKEYKNAIGKNNNYCSNCGADLRK